ncbi:MAG TPA: lipopolysaccharide heptosyltransferase II [Candidatus Ozemobacteraceae bacterium]|nr:lipopolysaccharide heptosyltransferase II [Candidatus Ozemobacteraceae bacterium]
MKIIVIGLNWLGDIVMSLPAMIAAAQAGETHVVTRPHLAEVYSLFELPLHIHAIHTNAWPHEVYKQLRPLRRLGAEQTIVLPDSLRAAMLAKVCGTAGSTGYAAQWRSLFLGRAVAKPADFTKMHEADLHYGLCREAGLCNEPTRPTLKKYGRPDAEFKALATKLDLPSKYLVMAPGAAFGAAKRWPPERFAALADLVAANIQLPIVITASASEQSIVEEICRSSKASLISAAGRTSLRELACLLSRAEALVANDSGTMHLAALYQTPTVVPVGPTDMVRTGPLNPNFAAVTASGVCPIAPCRQRTCPRHDHACMLAIPPEAVYAELTRLTGGSDAA